MPPRQRPSVLRLTGLALMMILIITPIILLTAPSLIRGHVLRGLNHDDNARRQRAMDYIARHAGRDAHVRDVAIQGLSVPDDARFQQIVAALEQAGQWHRPTIPDDAWLRWLEQQAQSPAPASRYHALLSLARLASQPATARQTSRLLGNLADDDNSTIATHAWIFLGLLDPIQGRQANWKQAESHHVAGAILWAVTRTNPDRPQPAIQAMQDPAVSFRTKAHAAYALSQSPAPEAQAALRQTAMASDDRLPTNATGPQAQQALVAWRAVLGLREPAPLPDYPPEEATGQLPLLWAKLHQHARLTGMTEDLTPWFSEDVMDDNPVPAAAILEALPPDSAALPPCPAQLPPLQRLAWTRATTTPDLMTIADLFLNDNAPLRDLACVTAWQRFSPAQLVPLIQILLESDTPAARQSGAMLSGLTHQRIIIEDADDAPDLLARLAHTETNQAVQTILHVGLWMQGRYPALDATFPDLLTRDDLPITTLHLAQLHRQPRQAMETLLSPIHIAPSFQAGVIDPNQTGEAEVSLLELLVLHRWIYVLEPFLPESTPPLWVWADPALHAFQWQVIQDHWLLHANAQ